MGKAYNYKNKYEKTRQIKFIRLETTSLSNDGIMNPNINT